MIIWLDSIDYQKLFIMMNDCQIYLKKTAAKPGALLMGLAAPKPNYKAWIFDFHTQRRKSGKKDQWFGSDVEIMRCETQIS